MMDHGEDAPSVNPPLRLREGGGSGSKSSPNGGLSWRYLRCPQRAEGRHFASRPRLIGDNLQPISTLTGREATSSSANRSSARQSKFGKVGRWARELVYRTYRTPSRSTTVPLPSGRIRVNAM